MEQNNEEIHWRDAEWRDRFFNDFIEELRLCDRENLEPNPQNVEEYNETRQRCQFIFNYYLTRVERIVSEMEGTETPREIVDNIINRLEDIITHHIFEGIVDEVSERVLPEDLQLPNPMLQGNNQEWSELSLVNHYNRLYGYYMRVIQYINLDNLDIGFSGGTRRRKKYRKNGKTMRSRKIKKSRKVNKKKSKKSRKYK